MSTSWVEVLVDPAAVAASASHEEPRKSAVALLLDGRLDDYERRGPDAGLPSVFGAGVTTQPDGESRLVIAVSLLAGGKPEALDLLASLAASQGVESDLRSIAAILAGIAMSDAGRPDLALPLLDERANEAADEVEVALLHLHWAVRAAECGRFVEAQARAASARATSQRAGDPAETIRIIAAHNGAHFEWLSGRIHTGDLPRRAESRPIAWMDILEADALEDYLDGHFKAFFEQPYRRSVSFGREDQTERGLSRALFRAECLADWQGLATGRKVLGRYRLLSEAGRTSPGAAYGLGLLRRGRDADGLELALGVFRAAGPLEPLRESGARASAMPWWPLELRAVLSILGQTAVALDAESAARALDRILGGLAELLLLVPGSGWVVDPVMKALAALSPVVDVSRQGRVSRAIRQLASEPPDPMIHQAIGRVLHSLDWTQLSETEVRHWLAFVRDNLGAHDDHVFPAMAAAQELVALRPRSVLKAALSAFRETQSLYLVPLLLRKGTLDPADRRAIEASVLEVARRMRRQASEGRYSFGLISVGALLGQLAVARRRRELLEEAVAFALDPKVVLEERIAAVGPLLAEPTKVPVRYRHRLARGLPASDIDFPLFGTPTELKGINLQLGAVFGDITPSQALGQLLELAHSSSQEGRLQAVRSLRAVAGRLDASTFVAVLVGLTHDPDPFVRASAGNLLAATPAPDASAETRLARLAELLDEGGELVPKAVWLGLAQRRRSGEPAEAQFASRAQRVAAGHIADTVRKAASQYLTAS
jgi:hypothetical protein